MPDTLTGPWHPLTITDTPTGRDYTWTHPGHQPDDCRLQSDLDTRHVDLLERCADLTPGEYRIRRAWPGALIETPDGTLVA